MVVADDSCRHQCGGQAASTCWCDSLCVLHDDCCGDMAAECPAEHAIGVVAGGDAEAEAGDAEAEAGGKCGMGSCGIANCDFHVLMYSKTCAELEDDSGCDCSGDVLTMLTRPLRPHITPQN